MSSNRRDFLKGFAAIAAAVPGIAFVRQVRDEPEPLEGPSPALTGKSGIQRHGDQSEFYVMSWSVDVETEYIENSGELVRANRYDEMHLEVYTEHPAALSEWVQWNPLTVELEQMEKTYRVKVTSFECSMAGACSDAVVTIDGMVKA